MISRSSPRCSFWRRMACQDGVPGACRSGPAPVPHALRPVPSWHQARAQNREPGSPPQSACLAEVPGRDGGSGGDRAEVSGRALHHYGDRATRRATSPCHRPPEHATSSFDRPKNRQRRRSVSAVMHPVRRRSADSLRRDTDFLANGIAKALRTEELLAQQLPGVTGLSLSIFLAPDDSLRFRPLHVRPASRKQTRTIVDPMLC